MTTDNVGSNEMQKDTESSPSNWQRGLYMLLFLILFGLGQSVLSVIALFQFFSLVISGKSNTNLAEFGQTLGLWMKAAADYQSCATEDKPFPWADWPQVSP